MHIDPEIIVTEDGSYTLLHPIIGDTYHSTHGALAESKHVFIDNGFDTCIRDNIRILEVGFGSGLNAWLTMLHAGRSGKTVAYTAVELYPITLSTASQLAYASEPGFMALHEAAWGKTEHITPFFSLWKIDKDLADTHFDAIFDLVYFDAFAPDSQPEMWTPGIFGRIFDSLYTGGILVTYSAKGDVKRALRAAGFEVRRLKGAPGKRHMLRAVKR